MDKTIHPYNPRLHEINLENVSKIICKSGVWDIPKSNRNAGLISFSGKYRHGSSGRDDALFIDWRIKEFSEIEYFWGLVVDLSNLDYEWGDDLDISWDITSANKPLRIVVSPSNREALSGVLHTEYFEEDLGIACAKINHAVRALKN